VGCLAQEAITALESLPVRVSPGPRGASSAAADRSSSLSGQLSALMQPFKLKLCRAPGERQLRDYSANVVLIEPLATFAAVEDFLWPRVRRSAPEAQSVPAPASTNKDNKRMSPRTTRGGAAGGGSGTSRKLCISFDSCELVSLH
jgi:E3 ubiquitin-protein ligase TRIP12